MKDWKKNIRNTICKYCNIKNEVCVLQYVAHRRGSVCVESYLKVPLTELAWVTK